MECALTKELGVNHTSKDQVTDSSLIQLAIQLRSSWQTRSVLSDAGKENRNLADSTPLNFSEKTQADVVERARHAIIWTGQDYPTGNSTRRETKRQTEETMGRQHQRVDWP